MSDNATKAESRQIIEDLERKLAESATQQAATSDILRVISQSPTDVKPVFDAIVLNAVRLFRCDLAFFLRRNGNTFSQAALVGSDGSHIPLDPAALPIDPEINFPSRTIVSRKNLHLPDWSAIDLPEHERRIHETYGINSSLFLPLVLRGGECFGLLALASKRPRIFGESEISLAESFRDQAVIAIENARLFNETQEALERQTATSDILAAINSSGGELAPVFERILEKAHQLCGAPCGSLQLYQDGKVMPVAIRGMTPAFAEFLRRGYPITEGVRGGLFADHPVQRIDMVEGLKEQPEEPSLRAAVELGRIGTMASVPLLRDGVAFGRIIAARQAVQPFDDKQIATLQGFAAQAVIAIENARLLNALRERTDDLSESLQQQTATADVLKVISRSAFDLDSVMNTLAHSASELCKVEISALYLREGDILIARGVAHADAAQADFLRKTPLQMDSSTYVGRTLLAGSVQNVADVEEETKIGRLKSFSEVLGFRSILFVPLMREGRGVGVFALARKRTGQYSQREVELVQTFADQAVIAIENVRLFDEVQARTRELAASLDDLRNAQDRLVQTEKLASLGQLTAGIAHEIKNPLNFVNNFSALSVELVDELDDTLASAPLDQKMRGDVGELTQTLKSNLEKVVQHGKRANSIVKNMLQHSREGSGDHRSADINAVVEDSLNLAYHGARAEKSDFTIKLQHDFDPQAGAAELYPQEIMRALLNLISNGFYAATKRKAESDDDSFEPVLRASTKNLGTTVEIRIRDNGAGIPAAIKEKMFVPFFTTKPTGEGTGLGLSITHDIIVKQHGGRIDVETEPGTFTEFIVTLPRGNRTSGG